MRMSFTDEEKLYRTLSRAILLNPVNSKHKSPSDFRAIMSFFFSPLRFILLRPQTVFEQRISEAVSEDESGVGKWQQPERTRGLTKIEQLKGNALNSAQSEQERCRKSKRKKNQPVLMFYRKMQMLSRSRKLPGTCYHKKQLMIKKVS